MGDHRVWFCFIIILSKRNKIDIFVFNSIPMFLDLIPRASLVESHDYQWTVVS